MSAEPKANRPIEAALWMLLSCAMLTILSAIARYLTAEMHPFMVVFFRLAFGMVFLLPLLLKAGFAGLRTDRLKLYGVRAVSSLGTMSCWFYALSLITVGEVTALTFTAPLFATVGAALVLGEVVRMRRWAATLIGFAGAMIIIRPGLVEFSAGTWIALSCAVFMGISMVIIKSLSRTDNPNTVVFYMALFMTPVSFLMALPVWAWPAQELWPWIVLTGLTGTIGHVTLVKAFSLNDVSAVLPFDFSRLPFAVVVGWIAFGEVIDLWTWVGAGVIFVSTWYIARREARAGAPSPPPPADA